MNKKTQPSIKMQIKTHAIALISIVIAVVSLSYNTWRNELSEDNRNQRYAAFEIILKLNELQQVVFYNHYDQDVQQQGNPRLGWVYVLTIKDLSMVLPQSLQQAALALVDIWGRHWETLHSEQQSKAAVDQGIDAMRAEVVKLLAGLN